MEWRRAKIRQQQAFNLILHSMWIIEVAPVFEDRMARSLRHFTTTFYSTVDNTAELAFYTLFVIRVTLLYFYAMTITLLYILLGRKEMNGTLCAVLVKNMGRIWGEWVPGRGRYIGWEDTVFVTDFLMRSLPRLSLREPNCGSLLHELRCPEKGSGGIRRIVVQFSS